MVRYQLAFPPPMLAWLKAESARRGVPVCEIIRGLTQAAMDWSVALK